MTRAEVLLNLGREDELDVEGLRRLARSIRRYTDPDVDDGARIEPAEGLEVVGSRPLGGAPRGGSEGSADLATPRSHEALTPAAGSVCPYHGGGQVSR